MCRKAVQIIGQQTQKNTKNIEANGTEDNSFNLLNIHFSSAGIVIGILIVLVFVYKIIKVSNVKSWSALCQCIFPCSQNRSPKATGAHHNVGGSVHFTQSNDCNLRTGNEPGCSPMYASRVPNRKSGNTGEQRHSQSGQNQDQAKTHFSEVGVNHNIQD